ncbi:MAG TPA: PP2C family serine/threonine-protein phosphatase [Thermoanaerobaculaceae bacterium]|nr:PP2C family serine/threonine-protein phosphatase [Thermoanaerobaculaceae bacterium]
MTVESRGLTDRGLRRHHNEDQFLVRDDLSLYVVADGMGGHAAGEVAADLAVREMERVVEATRDFGGDTWPEDWDPRLSLNANRLIHAIVSAHRRVTGAVESDTGLKGMGATIVACLVDGETGDVTVAHVGDSRAYLHRGDGLELLTSDHSWVHEQVVAGLLTEEAARNHPLKNVVTRALGGLQEPVVDIVERNLKNGDLLLLCSDGLNTMLSDDEILGVVAPGGDLTRIAHQLVAEANRRGGVDNITVILARAAA